MKEIEGQKLLSEVSATGVYYQPVLKSIFSRQISLGGCGVQSCALCLSAYELVRNSFPSTDCITLSSSPKLARLHAPWTEKNFYDLDATKKAGITQQEVSYHGMTLDQIGTLLRAHGCTTRVVHVDTTTSSQFRKDLVTSLSCDSTSGIILNFRRHSLSTAMQPTSHHSPVVAYHQQSDQLLVLDTAKSLEGHFWVSTDDMFKAMKTVDRTANKCRGYCVYSKSS